MSTNSLTLPRAGSFWTAAAVAAIVLWTSAAPSTSYPLYAADWHLTPTVTTAIFALYPLVLVIVLLVFGDIADHIGRRAAILIGLALLLVGSALFAVAPDVVWVFVGRAFMGAGVGFALSPASAAVVEFSRTGREKAASSITTAGTALGLVLATTVGGALVQYGPFPLHLDFWVLVAAIAGVGGLVWFLPRHTPAEDRRRWRPRAVHVPRSLLGVYVTAALGVSVAYMFGSVFLALGADIAEQLIRTQNVLLVGSVLAAMSAVIGITAIATRSVAPPVSIGIGSVGTFVAFALLLGSSQTQSLPLFLVTTLVSGAAYALLFSGGVGLIGTRAPSHHRAGTLSAVYLVAYVLQGAVAVGLGVITTNDGLPRALDLGSVFIGAFALAALVSAIALGRRPAGAAAPAATVAAATTGARQR